MSFISGLLRIGTGGAACFALASCQPALRPSTAPAPDAASSIAAQRDSTARANAVAQAESYAGTVTTFIRTDEVATPDAVMRAAASVFGDSTHFDGIADGVLSEEPTWDIDVRSYETHERVEHYIRLFTGAARDRMAARIQVGTHYEPMIRSKLRAAGMPEDLFYLALIESGYDPNAYSSAAAVGMWQFMSATGRGIGLRIDSWIDERRDPARSTDAAIQFLGSLQKQFGSLYLAAAAYNGGPGRVSRGLSRFAAEIGDAEGDDRFFALAEQDYLYRETKDYVPKLIAAALVAKTPERFGMTVVQQPEFSYDSLRIESGTSLAAVARAAEIPLDTLKQLNPAILRGAAPPDAAVWLRVPSGAEERANSAYAAMSSGERAAWRTVSPNKGESLNGLAKRAGVSTKEVQLFNPGLRTSRSGVIAAKQSVRIPASATLLAANSAAASSEAGATSSASATHKVRSGESLSVIAEKHGVSVSQIQSLNGLRSTRIQAGQTLRIRTGSSGRAAVATAESDATSTGTSSSSASPTGASKATLTKAASSRVTHLVKSGESLSVIAARYGVTVSALKSLNGLSSSRIKAGQRLVVHKR